MRIILITVFFLTVTLCQAQIDWCQTPASPEFMEFQGVWDGSDSIVVVTYANSVDSGHHLHFHLWSEDGLLLNSSTLVFEDSLAIADVVKIELAEDGLYLLSRTHFYLHVLHKLDRSLQYQWSREIRSLNNSALAPNTFTVGNTAQVFTGIYPDTLIIHRFDGAGTLLDLDVFNHMSIGTQFAINNSDTTYIAAGGGSRISIARFTSDNQFIDSTSHFISALSGTMTHFDVSDSYISVTYDFIDIPLSKSKVGNYLLSKKGDILLSHIFSEGSVGTTINTVDAFIIDDVQYTLLSQFGSGLTHDWISLRIKEFNIDTIRLSFTTGMPPFAFAHHQHLNKTLLAGWLLDPALSKFYLADDFQTWEAFDIDTSLLEIPNSQVFIHPCKHGFYIIDHTHPGYSICHLRLDETSAIEEAPAQKIAMSVYPNPLGASDRFYIETSTDIQNPVQIKIYHLNGEAIDVPTWSLLQPNRISIPRTSELHNLPFVVILIDQKGVVYTQTMLP